LIQVIAKDVDNDRGRVAGQNLFDSLRQERFEDKVYPWKLDQRCAQSRLRLFNLIPRQAGLEGNFELAVVRTPGILRLLGSSDTLCDRAHHRKLGQRSGHEPSEPLRLRDGSTRHRRHMEGEVALLEFRQEGSSKERQESGASQSDDDGRVGWGEGHISPGSSSETRDGGWTFCREHAAAVIGKDSREAKNIIARDVAASKVAATALVTAIEMLEGHPLLTVDGDTRLPLLTPFNSSAPGDIAREIEHRLKDGFRTFKIKIGKSWEDDARRVKVIQQAIAGRATMRLDANRAYSQADACRFAMSLDPTDIEDWEANAMVASVSPVPVMLDEPICELADVKRASVIANVGFCKLKLKRRWKPASRGSPFAMPASSMDF
jgi:enolase-like protein